MIYVIVSVYDQAAGAYGRPVFVAAVGQAMRSFTDEVNRVADTNEVNRHPEDFKLFEVGSFDDATGIFSAREPRLLCTAVDVKAAPGG